MDRSRRSFICSVSNACATGWCARPLLECLVEATGSTSTLTWIPWDWIRANTAEEPRYGPWYGQGPIPFMQVNNDRAMAAGLTLRPIADTAKDMIAEFDPDYVPKWGRCGFELALEAGLPAKWHAEQDQAESGACAQETRGDFQ